MKLDMVDLVKVYKDR